MYKLQKHRHLNKAPKELADVARLAVPLYVATRVQKVSKQHLSTGALNGLARTFKQNVEKLLGLNTREIGD